MKQRQPMARVRPLISFATGVLATLATVTIWWWVAERPATGGTAGMSMSAASGATSMPGMEMGRDDLAGMDMGGPAQERQVAVTLTPARRQAIGVRVGRVERRPLDAAIRTVGTVTSDERRVRQVNLRVAGWITHLAVDYTGQTVRAGDPLLTMYSPELAATQAEYRLAIRTQARLGANAFEPIRTGADQQVQAAAERLRRFNLSDEQIAVLEHSEPRAETTLLAPIAGVVTKKMALQGAYATPEMPLYEITDLSTVWVQAQVYEHDLAFVNVGQEAEVTLASYPNEVFRGRVVFIDRTLTAETRTAPVRLELPNRDLRIKPGMYGDVTIRVVGEPVLAVPREAVLDSGTRRLTFLVRGEGRFRLVWARVGYCE